MREEEDKKIRKKYADLRQANPDNEESSEEEDEGEGEEYESSEA